MATLSTGKRRHPSSVERAEMWQRWMAGESISQIASGMGRAMASIHTWISKAGGFPPRTPKRSARALSMHEREEISRGLCAGESLRSIARRLGRSPGTISREVARNGGPEKYRAAHADAEAFVRAKRPQRYLLERRPALARKVARKLSLRWAPQQISGWLRRHFPDDPRMNVSHETIYRTLFVQARGALKKELVTYLRHQASFRRPMHTADTSQRYRIADAISISERPAEAADRAVPGHWEGDLVFGGLHSFVATLVERRSRYLMLIKVDGKDTESVVKAMTKRIGSLPRGLMKTLTWDRGSEMTGHQKFTIATDVQVFFCDPQSPWQRGSNENTNGLLRQYFPKGMDLTGVSQAQFDRVAAELNGRPRKTLGYATPAEMLNQTVAATG